MPLISSFYGILIYIYKETDEKHHTPHFHAKYSGCEAVFDLDGNIITGDIPTKQRKIIEAWCLLHSEELEAAWTAWNEDGETFRIEGLR